MKKRTITAVITAFCLVGVIGGFTAIAGSMGYNQTPMPEIVEPTRRTLDIEVYNQAKSDIQAEDDIIFWDYYAKREGRAEYQPENPDDPLETDVKDMMRSGDARQDVKYVNLGKIIDIVAEAGYCESDLYEPLGENEVVDLYGTGGGTTTFGGDQDKICNFTIACCNTLNDQSVELTPVEVVRLQDYIYEKFNFWYGGWIVEETSKSIATCDLIRQTLPEDPLAA